MPNDHPEAPAVATRAVLFTATGFLVFVGISLVVLHLYYRKQINRAVFVPPTLFAEPRLQTDDAGELATLQAEQRGKLDRYTWIDRKNGIAAIPIEEAMKRIVARGAEAYSPIDSRESVQPPADQGGGKSP